MMSIKTFLETYGKNLKLNNASTLYKYVYMHESELAEQGIVDFQENFTKRSVTILKPDKLAEFLENIRKQAIEEKRKNYIKRKDRRKEQEDSF